MKARSNRGNPAAVKELQNPHRDNTVIGLRFYSPFQLTVSPRFFAFFMQYPGKVLKIAARRVKFPLWT